MKCLKTRIAFSIPLMNTDTYHGDLFYNSSVGCLIIRSVEPLTSDFDVDLSLREIFNGDAFTLIYTSKCLKNAVARRFSNLDLASLKVIIDDPKFFN